MIHLTVAPNNIATLTFSNENKPNIINQKFLEELNKQLTFLEEYPNLEGIILTGTKESGFLAGADLKFISQINTREEVYQICKYAQDTFTRLENFKKKNIPTIAAINGTCLGGGLELALACTHRIAVNEANIKIGLPEVSLGILPGFGGTVRLSRLVGFSKAADIICSAKQYTPDKAKKHGIIENITTSELLLEIANRFIISWKVNWTESIKKKKEEVFKQVTKSWKDYWPGREVAYTLAYQTLRKATKGQYPAPLKALEVIYKGLKTTEEKAYQLEREAVAFLLIDSPVAKKLINLFFLQELRKKTYPNKIEVPSKGLPAKVGILGAGLMGGGIAQIFASKGIEVELKDINQEALQIARKTVTDINEDLVKTGRTTEKQKDELLGRLTYNLSYENFAKLDYVIEAVVENMNVKKRVFREVEELVSKDCIIATNTSSLSVNELAKECKYPERVLGLHFFSPAYKMQLVEIIPGDATSPEVIDRTFKLMVKMGKIPVFCKDSTCFIVNRILGAYLNETMKCVMEGHSPLQIDRAMRQFGMPVGPCELMDEVGFLVTAEVSKRLSERWPETFEQPIVLQKLIEKKVLGKRASKEGFYLYTKNWLGKAKKIVSPKFLEVLATLPKKLKSKEDFVLRLNLAMKVEAQKLLDEGKAFSKEDIYLAMVLGTGYPPFKDLF